MWQILNWLFNVHDFQPLHESGPGWTHELVAVHVACDLEIAMVCMAVAFYLNRIARTRLDLGVTRFLRWLAAFMLGCGLVFIDCAAVFVWPIEHFDALIRSGTAATGIGVLLLLPTLFRAVVVPNFGRGILGHDLFEAVFQHAPSGIVIQSLQGELLRVNPAFSSITHRSIEDLEGKSIAALTDADENKRDETLFGSLVRGEIPSYSLERRYLLPNSGFVFVLVTKALIRDASGHGVFALAIVTDITDRVLVQQELGALRESLEEKAQTLSRKVAQLEDMRSGQGSEALQRLEEIVNDLKAQSKRKDDGGGDDA